MDIAKLKAPFDPAKISWRVGATNGNKDKGLALAYIDSRDVQDRLDDVCGPENWQSRFPHANAKTICEIGIRIGQEWVWKADGAGDTDVEAEKGAISDAFKRAAVRWGVGRYLYDVDSPWVKIEAAGRSFKIAEGEFPRLRAILAGTAKATTIPSAAAPATAPAPAPAPADAVSNWATAAEKAIATLKTKEAMGKWMRSNASGLDKVRDADKVLYDHLNMKISQRNTFIENLEPA